MVRLRVQSQWHLHAVLDSQLLDVQAKVAIVGLKCSISLHLSKTHHQLVHVFQSHLGLFNTSFLITQLFELVDFERGWLDESIFHIGQSLLWDFFTWSAGPQGDLGLLNWISAGGSVVRGEIRLFAIAFKAEFEVFHCCNMVVR